MKKNVLLVEDDPALRMVLREVLKDDFEIDEADNGDDGIHKGLSADNDIIILDYHLPKKDGLEVIAAVRQANPGIPVIVVTGYLNPESEAQFNLLGANKIFPKPFNYQMLRDTVRDLLAAKPQATPDIHPKLNTQKPFSTPEIASESEMLQQSLNALASLAEKTEFLQSLSEKYWIEPQDLSAIRETARCMEAELREFYGNMNNTLFNSGDLNAPLIRRADKPCVAGYN